jgi:hypothetical protein
VLAIGRKRRNQGRNPERDDPDENCFTLTRTQLKGTMEAILGLKKENLFGYALGVTY